MKLNDIFIKALELENLTLNEILFLYTNAPLSEIMFVANELKLKHKKDSQKVGWIIDRNVNITNVCVAQCKFCNFCRTPNSNEAYITSIEEYIKKIDEMYLLGGKQLLLQGGLNPKLGIKFYNDLFSEIKKLYPNILLHALSPTEIVFLSQKENLTYNEVLKQLVNNGLDSLPGAGAEILSDRVRQIVSPAKCSAQQWLDVMEQAHIINLPTSATMMFGFIETIEERIEHLIKIRNLQTKKDKNNFGFITFVPWTYQDENTKLKRLYPDLLKVTANEYLRLIAISRIVLNNIENIQASCLTVGKEVAQLSLYAGANDLGSIMIEENVVSVAGAKNKFDEKTMKNTIFEAGFIPALRNQKYEFV